jgi:rhodanese-related sulfurtransferase
MERMADTPEISVHEAQKRVQEGALLLDVREQNEYDEERIPGAQLLPLSELMARFEDELPQDREIIAQCRSGKRSAQATDFLRAQGFDVVNMEGGILRWKAEDLATEKGR